MVVPPAQALAEIQGTKQQIHTISRVVSAAECAIKPPPAQPVAIPAIIPAVIPAVIPATTPAKGQTITLAADALFAASAPAATARQAQARPATEAGGQQISLSADAPFAFGRSDLDAISPHGRASLDEMVKRLTSEYSQIDGMHVVGHADPIGRAAVNERLSVKRAQTVRDYLQQTGLPNVQITSDGKGSREPVVTHCDNAPTPEAISCHAPNRRVVIDIVGTRR
jgi:outer membrane protein OmpA-like peptidoglycan-associated protein